MTPSQPHSRATESTGLGEPVERFSPTSGRGVGYLSLAVIVGVLGYLVFAVHTLTGLRVGLALAFLGVLVWATQLRSRAAVYADTLHLKNSFRDTTIPLSRIDGVTVRRTLNVWVGDQRYVCVGIGQSLRKIVKAKSTGPSAMLGWDKLDAYTRSQTPLRPDQSVTDYATFVENRIEGLVEDARRTAARRTSQRPEHPETDAHPEHAWAWPEIVALAVLGAAFLVTLLL